MESSLKIPNVIKPQVIDIKSIVNHLEEINTLLEAIDPALGEEGKRYEDTANSITKMVVDIFYSIKNKLYSSTIKDLQNQKEFSVKYMSEVGKLYEEMFTPSPQRQEIPENQESDSESEEISSDYDGIDYSGLYEEEFLSQYDGFDYLDSSEDDQEEVQEAPALLERKVGLLRVSADGPKVDPSLQGSIDDGFELVEDEKEELSVEIDAVMKQVRQVEDDVRLTLSNGQFVDVKKNGDELGLTGSAVPALMKRQFEKVVGEEVFLGEEENGVLPHKHIESVRMSLDPARQDVYVVDFGQKLEGTADQVEAGGWNDMPYNRLVMEQTVEMTIKPDGGGITFEPGKVKMGVHAEDYKFLMSFKQIPGLAWALYQGGYTMENSESPEAKSAIRLSLTINSLGYNTKGELSVSVSVDNESDALSPRGVGTPKQGSYPGSWTVLPLLKKVLTKIPFRENTYQDSFAHFGWHGVSQ